VSLIEEFVPNAGYPNIKKTWRIYGIMFMVFLVLTLLIRADIMLHLLAAAFVFVMLSVILVTDRDAINVTISSLDGTFTYRTVDCFGKERDTTVSLPTAKVTYKFTLTSKNRRGYRLRLYNSYFVNRITLKESLDNTGFNVDQLDRMVASINKYGEVSV